MKRLLLLCIALLVSCGSDYRYNTSATKKLSLSIHVVPSALLGIEGSMVESYKAVSVQLNEKVEFWGFVHLDSVMQTISVSESLVNSAYFTIQHDTISSDKFRTSFAQAGIDTVVFHAIDNLRDTLLDTLILYVNTPLHITAKTPRSGTLDVNNSTGNKVPFTWDLSGVDSWETPFISLYLSKDSSKIDSITPIAVTSESSINLDLSSLCPRDSICRFWWRVIASVYSGTGNSPADHDTSSLLMFQTRRSSTEKAQAQIHIQEVSAHVGKGIWVKSRNRSTGSVIYWNVDTLLGIATSPQLLAGQWTVLAGDSLLTEFLPESLSIDLLPGSFRNTGDEIILKDKIAPQAWLLYHTDPIYTRTKDSLVFQLYDGGSGVDSSTITASWTSTRIPIIRKSQVIFRYDSLTPRDTTLMVSVHDKAGNSNQNCHWTLNDVGADTVWVLGPYCIANTDSSASKVSP